MTITPATTAARTMSSTLTMASHQWATRPADECFEDATSFRAHLEAVESGVLIRDVLPSEFRAGYDDKRKAPALVNIRNGVSVGLNNWSAGQLCRAIGVPLGFVSTLSGETAGRVMAERWDATAIDRGNEKIRLHLTGSNSNGWNLRAFTSTKYDRVPNARIGRAVERLVAEGWKLCPARPNKGSVGHPLAAHEVGPHTYMREGDVGVMRGLYAGDRDVFAFLVDAARPIVEPGSNEPLFRGICVSASDVGARAQELSAFIFRKVCGNHLIWDARSLLQMRAVHLGDSATRMEDRALVTLKAWQNSGTGDLVEWMAKAKSITLAKDRAGLVDLLFAKRILGRNEAERVAVNAERWSHQDGDPRSVWGVMQSITRRSQEGDGETFADARWDADSAARKVAAFAG